MKTKRIFTRKILSAKFVIMTLDELTKQAEELIPAKFYFQIAEVCELTRLPKSVLRFWESEFNMLKPSRTESGRRLYRRKDVLLLFKIKHLLYESKFTIEGARNVLESRNKNIELPEEAAPVEDNHASTSDSAADFLETVRNELMDIRRLLDRSF